MGALKDALLTAVLQHLRTQRNFQTLVLSLNAPNGIGPQSIRTAWSNLKDNGKDEGLKKSAGLQSVLKERLDLFQFHTNEKGHNLITLTPSAQDLDLAAKLPARGPAYTPPANPAAGAADQALLAAAMKAGQELQAAESKTPGLVASAAAAAVSLEPKAKKAKTTASSYNGVQLKGAGKGPGKHGFYQDIIWTPEMAAHNEVLKQKEAAMARALFKAADSQGGKRLTISQLGANFEVAQLKKDPQFRNHKLIDIIRFHENVFELVADSGIGGFVLNLQPGAEAALPDAETYFEEMNEEQLLLPERMEEPRSQTEKMQALRIEVCHVLYKRGGKAQLNEVGQDQKVQKVKSGLPKTLKLIEFLRQFPANFAISDIENGLKDITLSSADVSDTSMIERSIERQRQMTENFRNAKGKGKGRPGSPPRMGSRYDANEHAQQYLQQTANQQYLHAVAQHHLAASAYGAYGAPPSGYPPPGGNPQPGYPGSPGYGFGPPRPQQGVPGHLI